MIDSTTAAPLPRAQVAAGGRTIIADDQGRWSLDGLACGALTVTASRPRFLPDGQPTHLVLLSGSAVKNLELRLAPQAVIIGKIYDDNGNLLPGGSVTALLSAVEDGRRILRHAGAAVANDIGEYRLAGLAAGSYFLCAHGNGSLPAAAPDLMPGESCFPGPIETFPAGALEVQPGSELQHDFTVPQRRTVRVQGATRGLPSTRGVGIELLPEGPDSGMALNAAPEFTGDRFQIRGVTPGSWVMTSGYSDGKTYFTARTPVRVTEKGAENVVLRYEPLVKVSGTLRVVGAGPPVAPEISLRRSELAVDGLEGALRWVEPGRKFVIDNVEPGQYSLLVTAQPPFYLSGPLNITVTAGMAPVEVVLRDDGGSIDGEIAGPKRKAWVTLLKGDGRVWTAASDVSGHFKIDLLPPGEYRAYAWPDLKDVEYRNPQWLGQYAAGIVEVEPRQRATVRLNVAELRP